MAEEGVHDVQQSPQATPNAAASWFPAVPAPIKRVFDQFPLTSYPPNKLPSRSSTQSNEHKLYIFTSPQAARQDGPSFNPQCLKWQAYLKFVGIKFRTIPSNNHASPNGALPYLQPSPPSNETASPSALRPIPSSKLQEWVDEHAQTTKDETPDTRNEAYTSLLDHRLRNAWLYMMYLDELNFASTARELYVLPSTSNALVRIVLSRQLQDSAKNELLRFSTYIDVDDIMAEANKALEALSILLGNDRYFFGNINPGLFDASVFAYTHLIMDKHLGWKQNPLATYLKRYNNLIQHQERILDNYF